MVVCGAGSLAAEAKAHKKKTAAQLFDLQKTGAPPAIPIPHSSRFFLSSGLSGAVCVGRVFCAAEADG